MQEYPHHYRAGASGVAEGHVEVTSPGLNRLETAPPAEFGGPGDLWSPETLLVASVADCFILSFRAIARASKLDWTSLTCEVEGVLDRVDRVSQFTHFEVTAALEIPHAADQAKALRMLEKAENTCLITNSLKATAHLEAEVRVVA